MYTFIDEIHHVDLAPAFVIYINLCREERAASQFELWWMQMQVVMRQGLKILQMTQSRRMQNERVKIY